MKAFKVLYFIIFALIFGSAETALADYSKGDMSGFCPHAVSSFFANNTEDHLVAPVILKEEENAVIFGGKLSTESGLVHTPGLNEQKTYSHLLPATEARYLWEETVIPKHAFANYFQEGPMTFYGWVSREEKGPRSLNKFELPAFFERNHPYFFLKISPDIEAITLRSAISEEPLSAMKLDVYDTTDFIGTFTLDLAGEAPGPWTGPDGVELTVTYMRYFAYVMKSEESHSLLEDGFDTTARIELYLIYNPQSQKFEESRLKVVELEEVEWEYMEGDFDIGQ